MNRSFFAVSMSGQLSIVFSFDEPDDIDEPASQKTLSIETCSSDVSGDNGRGEMQDGSEDKQSRGPVCESARVRDASRTLDA